MSRITSEQVYEFVVSTMELHERTKRSAFTMHEIIVNAWVPGFDLPEIATAEASKRSFARVRKALVEEAGLTVVSVTDAYFRLVNSKRRFTVADAGKCLPRKANPAVGLLIVTEESGPRDQLIWRVSAGLEKPQTTTEPAAPAPAAVAEEAHLTIEQLAEREGVAVGTVYGWNSKGGGPRYIKIGKHVRYRMSDVLAWEESRLRQSGGSYVAA